MALSAAQIAQQKKQAEELLFSGPETLASRSACSSANSEATRSSPTRCCRRTSSKSSTRPHRQVRQVLRRVSRRRQDRPRRRHPAIGHRRPGQARRARHDRAEGSTAAAASRSSGYCKSHGSHRRPLCLDGGVRQRPPLDRHPRTGPVRHQGAEGRWLPDLVTGEATRRVRADRAEGRLRRRQRADDAPTPDRGRQGLHPQRHEALHHQRRHRRRADRDGPHARAGLDGDESHRVPRHARHARLRGRRDASRESAASAARPPAGWRSRTCPCRPRTSSASPAKA